MYSLIIVEDELIARERLTHMVKWETFGFHVDAAFSDGREVLDYLKYNTPDVILTDIKMTHTSGLDVAKYVSEHSMATKVVFLSGYEDFEYKTCHRISRQRLSFKADLASAVEGGLQSHL